MTAKKLEVVGGDKQDVATTFGDVLHAVCAEQRLSQFALATRIGYSGAAISRAANGSRPLSENMAAKFAEELGGTAEAWLLVYEQTKNGGSDLSVAYFRDLLIGKDKKDDLPGARVRRMLRDDIISIFGNPEGEMTFRGITEDCEIDPFDQNAVQGTSYDTHVGGYYFEDNPGDSQIEEVDEFVVIPAGEVRTIITQEHISLPSWLEADLNPAWSIGRKKLFVAHGPIIDPGKWSGKLFVNVYNPTCEDVKILKTEPFITLRFEMQDNS